MFNPSLVILPNLTQIEFNAALRGATAARPLGRGTTRSPAKHHEEQCNGKHKH